MGAATLRLQSRRCCHNNASATWGSLSKRRKAHSRGAERQMLWKSSGYCVARSNCLWSPQSIPILSALHYPLHRVWFGSLFLSTKEPWLRQDVNESWSRWREHSGAVPHQQQKEAQSLVPGRSGNTHLRPSQGTLCPRLCWDEAPSCHSGVTLSASWHHLLRMLVLPIVTPLSGWVVFPVLVSLMCVERLLLKFPPGGCIRRSPKSHLQSHLNVSQREVTLSRLFCARCCTRLTLPH